MAEFVVELYMPREDAAAVQRNAVRARAAAEEHSHRGTRVRYVRSIFIPEDETCLLLYEAASADAVSQAARGAQLRFDRITEAVQVG